MAAVEDGGESTARRPGRRGRPGFTGAWRPRTPESAWVAGVQWVRYELHGPASEDAGKEQRGLIEVREQRASTGPASEDAGEGGAGGGHLRAGLASRAGVRGRRRELRAQLETQVAKRASTGPASGGRRRQRCMPCSDSTAKASLQRLASEDAESRHPGHYPDGCGELRRAGVRGRRRDRYRQGHIPPNVASTGPASEDAGEGVNRLGSRGKGPVLLNGAGVRGRRRVCRGPRRKAGRCFNGAGVQDAGEPELFAAKVTEEAVASTGPASEDAGESGACRPRRATRASFDGAGVRGRRRVLMSRPPPSPSSGFNGAGVRGRRRDERRLEDIQEYTGFNWAGVRGRRRAAGALLWLRSARASTRPGVRGRRRAKTGAAVLRTGKLLQRGRRPRTPESAHAANGYAPASGNASTGPASEDAGEAGQASAVRLRHHQRFNGAGVRGRRELPPPPRERRCRPLQRAGVRGRRESRPRHLPQRSFDLLQRGRRPRTPGELRPRSNRYHRQLPYQAATGPASRSAGGERGGCGKRAVARPASTGPASEDAGEHPQSGRPS